METVIKNHIISYLSDPFISALLQFEHLVQSPNYEPTKYPGMEVFMKNPKSLELKMASNLTEGENKNVGVELTVLRVLWNEFKTFILTTEKLPVYESKEIFCLVIDTSILSAPFSESWKQQLGPMSVLYIKEPYIEIHKEYQLKIIQVLLENAEVRKSSKAKCNIPTIKKAGNDFFNNSDYLNALYCYEYCLACCNSSLEYSTRSILYTNSAASLYKLNLYDNSIKYSEITSKIDRGYYKAYVWRVHCLLEKKCFGEVPNLLVILQDKTHPNDFLKLNTKYSIYLSNSLGMYNWKSISETKSKKSELILSDYMNKSIGLRMHEGKTLFYTLEPIKKQTIIVIKKPFFYEKKGMDNKQSICDKIVKILLLQKSFYSAVQDMVDYLTPNKEEKTHNRLQELKEVERNVLKCLTKPKDIMCNESEALGVWSETFKLGHNCNPNCSIVHFDCVMIISTCSNIAKGEILTVDFASGLHPTKRKEFLLEKFSIYCKCTVCEWKSWPDFTNRDEVIKVADSLTNITMMKQVFWEMLSKGFDNSSADILIKKLTKVVMKEINWGDVLIAMRLLREDTGKMEDALKWIIEEGLRGYLKIPSHLCREVIVNLK